MLREKKTNLPVVIVEEKCISDFLLDIDEIKMISYSSLGNDNGVLIGFLPDSIKIYSNEDCIEKRMIVGIYEGKLCEGTNEYNAIIGLI